MIPLKIQIKNFLSYGPETQTIPFGEYPLICLSGKNGHGKSALLDAVTWALWGHARKTTNTAKADQGLLRLGQSQMMVCLDFICNNQHYRVRREFAQTYGKPYAALDFGLLETASDRFISLTEKTIRETQEKIDAMLHLNYDAFINSAFLRQGHANEFSKKSPKERKEILASILGLDQYEVIRRRAAEKGKLILAQKTTLLTLQQKMQQELTQLAPLQSQLQTLQEKQRQLGTEEQELLQARQKITTEKECVTAHEQQLQMMQYKKEQLENQQLTLTNTLNATFQAWRTMHRHHLLTTDIPILEHKKKELVHTVATFQAQLQEQLLLKEKILTTKERLQQIMAQVHEQQQQALTTQKISVERLRMEQQQREIQHTQILAQQKELSAACTNTEAELAHLSRTFASIQKNTQATVEKQFEKRKEHYQRWIAHANYTKSELETLERKYHMVDDEQAPSCPLCEQNLSASRRRFLKKKFDEDTFFLRNRFKRLSTLIKTLKPILIEQHATLEHLKKQHEHHLLLQKNIETVQQTHAKQLLQIRELKEQEEKGKECLHILAQTLTHEQHALEQTLHNLKQELQNNPEIQALHKVIREAENKLQQQPYSSADHEHARIALETVEKMLASYQSLQQEKALQQQRMHEVHTLCAQMKHLKREKIILQKTSDTLMQKLAYKELLSAQESQIDQKTQELIQRKELLLQEKASIETQYKKLQQIQQEYQTHCQEVTTCEQLLLDYQAIATATGKDGIQALLIEDAIPEIEHEANTLLGKLTENQMQLFIESLRDLKKGGTKETLDIKISDVTGIRPYELFSGGEAFRIDFALRIAISKLLARRAGTSLQTLIIDEGFGSQDEEGLGHIMDALYKIQDDFAKIIIVSHLATMKNQFPVHFVVEKGPNGSMISIIEQG